MALVAVAVVLGLCCPALAAAPTAPAAPPSLVAPRVAIETPHGAGPTGGSSAPCVGVQPEMSDPRGPLTLGGLAELYGFSALHRRGDLGAGTTIAIVEFSPVRRRDVMALRSCLRTAGHLSVVVVDGGSALSGRERLVGALESDLDIDTTSVLAPGAAITVVEGRGDTYAHVLDAYSAAIATHPTVVLSTWGACEPDLPASFLEAEAALFESASAEGETVVAAAGDNGSLDCGDIPGGSVAVDDPADQPSVLAVGGTAFGTGGTPVVWNDGPGETGGGGLSTAFARPAYQDGVAGNVAATSGGLCAGSGGCRMVPDVSADAGSPVEVPCGVPLLCRGGALSGGTSLAAPIWAGVLLLAQASPACASVTIGPATPLLYDLAAGTRANSALVDVASGDNDPEPSPIVLYRAVPGYNLASGLGAPRLHGAPSLVEELCAAASAPRD